MKKLGIKELAIEGAGVKAITIDGSTIDCELTLFIGSSANAIPVTLNPSVPWSRNTLDVAQQLFDCIVDDLELELTKG